MSTSKGFVESLEGRQFFAAQPLDLSPGQVVNAGVWASLNSPEVNATPAKATGEVSVALAPVNPAPVVQTGSRPVSLVGDFTGSVKAKVFMFSKKLDFELNITDQTINSITGTITVQGHDYTGTLIGKINPKNGRFKYVLKGDDHVSITGQLSKSGNTIGGGDVKAEYHGFNVKGGFRIDRTA
ncbi:MAG: hypothetical protein JWO31_1712 [Phycisphaerales bacterium]|nr:hypothetical protein [Phycisphaerales bacterium]